MVITKPGILREKIPVLVTLLMVLIVQAGVTQDGQIVYHTDSGNVEFDTSVPLHSFTSDSPHLTGMIDFEENLVDFFLDLETVESGIRRRDRDMYQALNTEEYPFAEFTGSLVQQFDTTSIERQEVTVEGEFTVHGVTREITVTGFLEMIDEELQLEAGWILDMTDYGISPPRFLFLVVEDELDVHIEAVLKPVGRDEI